MNVTLSPETQKLLEDRMQRGDYSNPDAAIRAALRSLDERDVEPLDEETMAAIEEAEAQFDRGEGRAWEEVVSELRARYFNRQ